MKNKKRKSNSPTRSIFNVLRQVCNLIPNHLVPKLARETGVDDYARTYQPWSHVVTMTYSQLAHSIGLNDVCDALQLNSGPLSTLRGATAPSRNNLSHANKVRDAVMAEKLFWEVKEHLCKQSPGFLRRKGGKGFARKLNRAISAVDSSTIELIARCTPWAQHRRRKAAAKCHVRLNLQSFLPSCVIIDTAREHDNKRARELCAEMKAGEISIFDKAYLDFEHLYDLERRKILWVTRAKDNLQYELLKSMPVPKGGKILRDEIIGLKRASAQAAYPDILRRVTALVEVDGKEVEMVFLTNQMEWSPQTIADLYQSRWEIEVFFKQIKQTLQLADFLGTSANAVRWQVWIALLVYLLLRYLAYLSKWSHSFTRLFTIIRASLWRNWDLRKLLERYGTAGGSFRYLAQPEQAYLPGFGKFYGTAS